MPDDKSSNEPKSLAKRDEEAEVVQLSDALANLPEEQRVELQSKLAEGLIEANTKAAIAGTEARSLKENLHTVTDAAIEATKSGSSVTLSHVQETEGFKSGGGARTEILTGDTERVKSGQLTKTQTGEKDWTPYYIIGGIVAITFIGIAIANSL
jgi:hypothetical protein